MHEWHNDECDLEWRYETMPPPNSPRQAVRAYWCNTHGQWAYDFPERVTYHYSDEADRRYDRVTGKG